MAKTVSKPKKQFFISLEDIDLTDEQLMRIDKGIQNVVLKELANIENAQNFSVQRDFSKIKFPNSPKPFPFPFPWGIIVYNPKNPWEQVIGNIKDVILKK